MARYKALTRPCLGCGRLTPNTRCTPCYRARERARGASVYSTYEWIAYSRAVRAATPYCERCGCSDKRLSVDHIIPLSQGGALCPPRAGVRVLCWQCHNTRDHWDGPEGRMANDGGLPTHTPHKRAMMTAGESTPNGGEGQKFVLTPPLAAPGIPVRNNASFDKTAIPPTETEEQE
jgi:5-methylcytosine-specific restriction endonuclease McrA